jgi:hypothetical protein
LQFLPFFGLILINVFSGDQEKKIMKTMLSFLLAVSLLSIQVSAEEKLGTLPIYEASTQAIEAATTDPMFLTGP